MVEAKILAIGTWLLYRRLGNRLGSRQRDHRRSLRSFSSRGGDILSGLQLAALPLLVHVNRSTGNSHSGKRQQNLPYSTARFVTLEIEVKSSLESKTPPHRWRFRVYADL